MRADRLLSILLLLQSRGKITSRELAGKLEVSKRTIIRDMEALSASGVPVLAERGREGGWMLSEGYRTSLTGMKPQEIGALLLAADSALLRALGIEEDFSSASRKLEAASPGLQDSPLAYLNQRIHIDGAGWHASGESFPYLSLLQQAVWEERKVTISYLRGEDSREYVIAPLGLISKRGVWYVAAENAGMIKSYRVSRLLGAAITGEAFIRPEGFVLAEYWDQSTAAFKTALPRYPARLLVKAEVLQVLERERYVTIRSSEESDLPAWLRVAADFHTLESASRIILSLSPGIIASEPEELVSSVLSVLNKTAALYEEIQSRNKT